MAEISHYYVYLDSVQSLHSTIATVYASSSWITRFSLTKKLCLGISSYTSLLKIFVSSRVLSPHCKRPHHFSATRDDKINDCGFKFSVACEWRVEEEKEDLLQFAKIFPDKFLKLPICQIFPSPSFCALR